MSKNKRQMIKQKFLSFSFFILVFIIAFILGIFVNKIDVNEIKNSLGNKIRIITHRNKPLTITNSSKSPSPEIKAILASRSTNEQKPYLLKLLKRIGPEKTQEELLKSGLPFTGESHLLVHTIGDYLYKKYGSKGLSFCKEYFLSACYHAFIINDLSDNGIKGLAKSMDQCIKAGPAVFAQCAHASGHGFVVWNDYDLPKAATMCDELGSNARGFPLFNCYDGVFMENLFSVHEGKLSPKRWVKSDDPYYPCNDPRIPEKYLQGCWANQASLMYQMYRGDWKKVAEGCDNVVDPKSQETCYNNFARQIHPETKGHADRAFTLCQNATGPKWRNYCLNVLVNAAFSVGDRKSMPYEICHRMNEPEKKGCYSNIFGMIAWYEKNPEKGANYCNNIKDKSYQKDCISYQNKPHSSRI